MELICKDLTKRLSTAASERGKSGWKPDFGTRYWCNLDHGDSIGLLYDCPGGRTTTDIHCDERGC